MNEAPIAARLPIQALRYWYTEWSCSGIAQTPNDSTASCDHLGVTRGRAAAFAAGVRGDAQPLKTGAAAPAAAATAPRLRTWRRESVRGSGLVLEDTEISWRRPHGGRGRRLGRWARPSSTGPARCPGARCGASLRRSLRHL